MSAVMLLVMKAIAAYRLWHRRIKAMSLMADRLAAAQTGLPHLDLSHPGNLRTWRELRAYQFQRAVYEDKIRQLEVRTTRHPGNLLCHLAGAARVPVSAGRCTQPAHKPTNLNRAYKSG